MSVKHVSAPKPPGMPVANPRRTVNTAAARPTHKSSVVPADGRAATDGEAAVAQALANLISPPETDMRDDGSSPAMPGTSLPAPSSSVVDYYAIITRTVSSLALNNAENRAEVYARARETVQTRLKDASPAMSSRMVATEQLAFDRAIKKIEAEQAELELTRAAAGGANDTLAHPPNPETFEATAAEETTGSVLKPTSAPAIIVTKRVKPAARARQTHGGTLRLFALLGLVLTGFAVYWIAIGKPNFAGLSDAITVKPQIAQQRDSALPQESAASSEQPSVAAPSPLAQTEDDSAAMTGGAIDATSPAAYNIQLATFLLLCRPAPTEFGQDACGNLQPRPFGGADVAPRTGEGWGTMYRSLSNIRIGRVGKPVFSAPKPAPAAHVSAEPSANTAASSAPATQSTNAAAKDRYARGVEFAKNDNLDGAIAEFSEAIRLDPKFTDAYVQRGQAMFKNGNAERAVADLTQALQIDPRNAQAFKARGMTLLYKGDDDGAIVDLTKAIQYAEIDAGSILPIEVFYARRSRAQLYDRKQLYDRELLDYNAMIDGYWRDPGLAATLKATYREQGAASLMASIYRLRAGVHQKRNSLDAAIGDLSFAIQLDPPRALQYLIERGRLLEAAGRKEQAAADYEQALQLNPNNTDVRNALTRAKERT